jgi:hypothetical protein
MGASLLTLAHLLFTTECQGGWWARCGFHAAASAAYIIWGTEWGPPHCDLPLHGERMEEYNLQSRVNQRASRM